MRVLQVLAVDAVAEFQRSLDPGARASELSDEDVVARLLDPRAFGLFARRVLDARVSREVKIAVADRAFDLIPIPASEHAVRRVAPTAGGRGSRRSRCRRASYRPPRGLRSLMSSGPPASRSCRRTCGSGRAGGSNGSPLWARRRPNPPRRTPRRRRGLGGAVA